MFLPLQLDLSSNRLCGLYKERVIDRDFKGTYTTEGIVAIADALKGNASY